MTYHKSRGRHARASTSLITDVLDTVISLSMIVCPFNCIMNLLLLLLHHIRVELFKLLRRVFTRKSEGF
ncbi:hypothetical protein RvY_06276 [Ramazzottius varieornatus]|uniref:Uncharacterized protein n=1 Tax=Ramazzottius varieornatus TaxID=947166 RepID=A0A1D1V1I1_RAMVA|nr:hypothetical protein RvY_06276 [Ramazzottius varieornatus]